MNSLIKNLFFILIFISLSIGFFSCEDDNFTSNSSHKISFSTDTLSFDTVFTTLVTPTRKIMVYNKTSENILIENISLHSSNNYFQVNVNGKSGKLFRDVELRAKDSLHIFVQVMVNQLGQNAPIHILDSLTFGYNNNLQKIMLQTYGQDVHLLKKHTITENTRWINDKPYLIHDTLAVDSGVTLTLEEGSRLFFHNNATMVVKGTLNIDGNELNPVVFRGDRLDNLVSGTPYDKVTGQWGGILLAQSSTGNRINGAMIRNSVFGIQIDSAAMQPDVYRLVLSNSQIHNIKQNALKATNANVYVYNSVLSNSNTCVLLQGGNYLFNQTTIANYLSSASALALLNYVQYAEKQSVPLTLSATFNNCIVYGSSEREIRMDNIYKTGDVSEDFNYKFNACLIRYKPNKYAGDTGFDMSSNAFQDVIWHEKQDDIFRSIETNEYDFRLKQETATIETGDAAVIDLFPECKTDKNGVIRLSGKKPDLGAYEYVEDEIEEGEN